MSLWPEVLEALIKSGTMLNVWSSKLKFVVLVLALAAYAYMLFALKTAYMRSKRLDSIENLALKNEKLINQIHGLDQKLMQRVHQLDGAFVEIPRYAIYT